MILKFMTIGDDRIPHYISIDTEKKTYSQAAAPEAVHISREAYSYILKELNFNMWNYAKDFYQAERQRLITAEFKDGRRVEYTADILDLLTNDPAVSCITDSKTGEVLYTWH